MEIWDRPSLVANELAQICDDLAVYENEILVGRLGRILSGS